MEGGQTRQEGNLSEQVTKLELVGISNLEAINLMLIEDKMKRYYRARRLLRVASRRSNAHIELIGDLKN